MITDFWSWLYQAVNGALSWLNTAYNNDTMKPFFNLFLVVFAVSMIIKYLVNPMLGGGSDKAKRKDEE